jgi:hypothetical protein
VISAMLLVVTYWYITPTCHLKVMLNNTF